MASPKDCVVGFWSRKALASNPGTGYLFCGLRVGPRHVLTVSHGLDRKGRLWARSMAEGMQAFEAKLARPEDRHPEFDAALLTLSMAPTGEAWQDWAYDVRHQDRADLYGVFEGERHQQAVQLHSPDAAERHHLFTPKQPLGVSGGALIADGQLWGMAVQRYAEEEFGCALPFYLLRDWLRERLVHHGVRSTALPPSALPPHLASLQRWLDDAPRTTLKTELEDAAKSAPGAATPATVHSLQRLASHQSPDNPIAGIHLLGRALVRTRDALGEAGYRQHIAPRVTDLFCCVVAPAFDGCCVEPPPPHDEQAPASRLSRPTPFEDLNLSAVLAARLFGGSLRFAALAGGAWRPEWVFPIDAPPNGEQAEQAFFREAYRRMVLRDTAELVAACRESRALSETEMAELRYEIQACMIQDENLLVFIDAGATARVSPGLSARAERFARATGANVLVQVQPDNTQPQLRLPVTTFQVALKRFLGAHLPSPAATHSPAP